MIFLDFDGFEFCIVIVTKSEWTHESTKYIYFSS